MKLETKFGNRIDSDSGYDNLKIAQDLVTIAEKHYTEQLDLHGVNKRTLKRICEHEDCNKEFTLELNLFGDKSKANIAMMECPHCNKRNDLWLELS
jgi:hypothetical protein